MNQYSNITRTRHIQSSSIAYVAITWSCLSTPNTCQTNWYVAFARKTLKLSHYLNEKITMRLTSLLLATKASLLESGPNRLDRMPQGRIS